MNKINIIFSSDNNYAQFLGVTLCSLFENKTCPNTIDIYVLDGGINDENKNKLSTLENTYNFKINYIKIDTEFFKDFYISHHITQAAYYRIIIPDLLPKLDKILYLDCDIIINKDLLELYNTDIENYYLAAVEEPVEGIQDYLKIPKESKYFNSGVMLINLKKWRENKITEIIINFIKNNPEKIKTWDQDALNAILYNNWIELPYKYNYTTSLVDKYKIKKEELDKIVIIHYSSSLKPWNYRCTHIYKYKYFNYLKKTPWKNIKIIDLSFSNIIKKIITSFIPLKIINFIKLKIKI